MEKLQTVRMRIKTRYRDMSVSDKLIADYVLSNMQFVSTASINEIAEELKISTSTFFQFTKRLGYEGFKDFKISLLTEGTASTVNLNKTISNLNSPYGVTIKVFESSVKALEDTKSTLNEEILNNAIEILASSDSICFFGLGGSGVVAFDAYQKFLRSPIPCNYSSDYHIQLMYASFLTEKGCAVIISHTGLSKESIEFAKLVKERGAHIIAITSYPLSPLAKMADVVLISIAEEMTYRSESFASRLTQLAIIDSLFVNVMYKNEQAAKQSLKKINYAVSKTKLK